MKNPNELLDQPDNKEMRKPIFHLMNISEGKKKEKKQGGNDQDFNIMKNAQNWRNEFQTEGSAEYPTQQC